MTVDALEKKLNVVNLAFSLALFFVGWPKCTNHLNYNADHSLWHNVSAIFLQHSSLSPDGKLLIIVGDNPNGMLVDSKSGKVLFLCVLYNFSGRRVKGRSRW